MTSFINNITNCKTIVIYIYKLISNVQLNKHTCKTHRITSRCWKVYVKKLCCFFCWGCLIVLLFSLPFIFHLFSLHSYLQSHFLNCRIRQKINNVLAVNGIVTMITGNTIHWQLCLITIHRIAIDNYNIRIFGLTLVALVISYNQLISKCLICFVFWFGFLRVCAKMGSKREEKLCFDWLINE